MHRYEVYYIYPLSKCYLEIGSHVLDLVGDRSKALSVWEMVHAYPPLSRSFFPTERHSRMLAICAHSRTVFMHANRKWHSLALLVVVHGLGFCEFSNFRTVSRSLHP